MIIYQQKRPVPPLAPYIELFWFYQSGNNHSYKERLLPTGAASLVFNLHEDTIRLCNPHTPNQFQTIPGAIICGAHSAFSVIDTIDQQSVIGIQFLPGGTIPFLPLPGSELHNQNISLDAILNRNAHTLRERLLSVPDISSRFTILEQFLLTHLTQSQSHHPAVTFALQHFQTEASTTSIASIVNRIGMSQKRFIHLFRETVGLTPKQFCRVQRFQQTLQHLEHRTPIHWSELALDCGYYDQAHFIHDFQAFSGLTPSSYLATRGRHRNHILLPQA